MTAERLVRFRPRAVLSAVAVVVAVAVVLWLIWIARHVITWMLIALFLTLALNPAVAALQRRGMRRGWAVTVVFVVALAAIGGIVAFFVPVVASQVNDFVNAIPGYIHDLTHGRGQLGFLERKYHVVEKARKAIGDGGAGTLFESAGVLVSVGKSVLTGAVATVTIVFLTLFMLLEGPAWVERCFGLMKAESRPRWRAVGHDIYRTVGGYVSGNVLISLIAGVAAGVVLAILGVSYAVALGLVVGILDLIPLAGATIGAIIVCLVAFTASTTDGIVMIVFFIIYQQLENHLLQPLVYGRTVNLSPLAVLIAVLVGAEVAGILGALGAIPIAGSIQVLLRDFLRRRRERAEAALAPGPDPTGPAGGAGEGAPSPSPSG